MGSLGWFLLKGFFVFLLLNLTCLLGFNRATTEGEGTCMTRRFICGSEKSLKSSPYAGFEAFAAKSAQRVRK
jgi:hypothetical protein